MEDCFLEKYSKDPQGPPNRHSCRAARSSPGLDTLETLLDPVTRETFGYHTIQTCWTLASELTVWRQTVRIHHPNYALSAGIPSVDTFAAAHILCIYWDASIVVYGTLRSLLPPVVARDLPRSTDPRMYFPRVVGASGIMLHPSFRAYGVQLTHFSTAIVLMYDGGWR